jgi:hypothetical protein
MRQSGSLLRYRQGDPIDFGHVGGDSVVAKKVVAAKELDGVKKERNGASAKAASTKSAAPQTSITLKQIGVQLERRKTSSHSCATSPAALARA